MKRILMALLLTGVLMALAPGTAQSQEREPLEGRGQERLRDADSSREDFGELFDDDSHDTRLREDREDREKRRGQDRDERHRRRGRDRDRDRDRREDRDDEPFDDHHPGPGGGE